MPVATSGRHAAIELLLLEPDALRSALDASRLKSLGLSIDQRGRIVFADGRAAFPIGFATALLKLAAAFGAALAAHGAKDFSDMDFGGITDITP